MIIIGYPGIGKSTLSNKSDKYIDLESSTMWIPPHDNFDRTRWSNWSYVYKNIAEDLSRQGYVVFVSSHKDVQDRFIEGSSETVYLCYPSIELRDQWVEKLDKRYKEDPSKKNKAALENVVARFKTQVGELDKINLPKIKITSVDYDLDSMIKELLK